MYISHPLDAQPLAIGIRLRRCPARPQARILHTMPTDCGCSRAVGQSDKWDSGADGNGAEEEGDGATVGQWDSGPEGSWEEEQRGSLAEDQLLAVEQTGIKSVRRWDGGIV
jgi:hypothetical protein